MRARSISCYYCYAVEQTESCSIRGAASHIRQEVNGRKSAPNHPRWCAFLIVRSPVSLIKKRRSSRPALRKERARSISYYAVEQIES